MKTRILITVLFLLADAAMLWAAPPSTLTEGGSVMPAPACAATSAVWRVYPVLDPAQCVTGVVALLPNGPQQEGFETGDFSRWPWTFSGMREWSIQDSAKNAGIFAAASGDLDGGAETSDMQVMLECVDGAVSFVFKVSSRRGWDGLLFYIDDIYQKSWSGERDWTEVSFPVTAGTHTFRWSYMKSDSVSEGSDKAWVDQIAVSTAVPQPAATVWYGDTGAAFGKAAGRDGGEHLAVLTAEDAAGTTNHTGFSAVMNHALDGSDPGEFQAVTMRPVPVPTVCTDSGGAAVLIWCLAASDVGEGGATNVVGYDVYRSVDGVAFTRINADVVAGNVYTDAVPDASSYVYALSSVFRGDPPVRTGVLSANSRPSSIDSDTDADGIPDHWETSHGLNAGNPADAESDLDCDGLSALREYQARTNPSLPDTDGDGMKDGAEAEAGTDPLSADSLLRITHVGSRTPLNAQSYLPLAFQSISNKTYVIQVAPAVTGEWLTVSEPFTAVSNRTQVLVRVLESMPQAFYRVQLSISSVPSTFALGYNLPDQWLSRYDWNKLPSETQDLRNADDDPDGDGMSNQGEMAAGTDPTDSASCLRIMSFRAERGLLSGSVQTTTDRVYYVESCLPGESVWHPVTGLIGGQGCETLWQVVRPAGTRAGFFRAVLGIPSEMTKVDTRTQ